MKEFPKWMHHADEGSRIFNSQDEVVEDPSDTDPTLSATDAHSGERNGEQDDEMPPEPPVLSSLDVSRAIERALLYERQREDGDAELIRQLFRYRDVLTDRRLQASLTDSNG